MKAHGPSRVLQDRETMHMSGREHYVVPLALVDCPSATCHSSRLFSGRNSGKRITSQMERELVSSIMSRSK